MAVAGRDRVRQECLDGHDAVAGYRPGRQRAVTEDVVTQLDHFQPRHRPFDQLVQMGFGPAVEQVHADAETRHLSQLDGVGEGVGDVQVGVQPGRVLDRECNACPVGVFEIDQFGKGTEVLSKAIAASPGFSIAGGGDTLAAIDKYGIADQVSYISTGGGAFLEYVEGKTLPAVAALEKAAQEKTSS